MLSGGLETRARSSRTSTGRPFLVSDFVDGPDFVTFAASDPVARVTRLQPMVLEALAFIHRRGVLHLDLKPANVLVEGTPDAPRPRLLDSGLGGRPGERLAFPRGTPAWMAPEQLGGGTVDERTDLHALGLHALEALAGNAPRPERPSTSSTRIAPPCRNRSAGRSRRCSTPTRTGRGTPRRRSCGWGPPRAHRARGMARSRDARPSCARSTRRRRRSGPGAPASR